MTTSLPRRPCVICDRCGLEIPAGQMKCGCPKHRSYITKAGYRLTKHLGHPRANERGYVFEHILVMEQHLGRSIEIGETVHHRNGVRSDNRLENLELWSSNHPNGQRIEDLVEWAKSILMLYEPESLAESYRPMDLSE